MDEKNLKPQNTTENNPFVTNPLGIYAKTVAFTGRRPKDLLGYEYGAYELLREHLLYNALEPLFQNGSTRFISGGAQGFDQIAFWAVDELRQNHPNANIENILYLPNKIQANRWMTNGLFGKDDYMRMCARATSIKVINKSIDLKSSYYDIIKSLYMRNHAMVNKADLLIALVPYKEDLVKGGTKETIDYAKKKNVPILPIRYILTNKVVPVEFFY